MTDLEFEKTYLVTFEAGKELHSVVNIRSITLAATTTDVADATVLAYQDLVDEFGVEIARHFTLTTAHSEENK